MTFRPSVLVLISFVGFIFCKRLPDTFTLCREANGEEDVKRFIDCFYKAADDSRIGLIKGVPGLGIPAIVGLVIPKITIEQNSRAVQVVATLTNVSVEGLEKYDLYHFGHDPKIHSFLLNVRVPFLSLNGNFDVGGRVLNQKVNQQGKFKVALNDTLIDIYAQFDINIRKGVEYGDLTKFDVNPTIGKAVGYFEDLFGQNTVLNKATNAFLADSTDDIIAVAKPDVVKLLHTLVKRIGTQITRLVPWRGIFPLK